MSKLTSDVSICMSSHDEKPQSFSHEGMLVFLTVGLQAAISLVA